MTHDGKIKTTTTKRNLRRQNKIYDSRICCTSFCSRSFNHCYTQSKIIIEYFDLVQTLINSSFRFPVGKTLLKVSKTISFFNIFNLSYDESLRNQIESANQIRVIANNENPNGLVLILTKRKILRRCFTAI